MAISQYSAGAWESLGEYDSLTRRGVEDAAPYKACAVGGAIGNLRLPMALTERRGTPFCGLFHIREGHAPPGQFCISGSFRR